MNRRAPLEDRLESLGAALRARPLLSDRVMEQIRQEAADGAQPQAPAPRGRRRLLTATGLLATLAAAVLIAVTILPSRSVGWNEVTAAIQAQRWIRGTATLANGTRGHMWLSPQRGIWAFKFDGSSYFSDSRQKARYEFHRGETSITKSFLGNENAQQVLPTAALEAGDNAIGSWLLGTEKIVGQKRREVNEDGKTWIEFDLVLWRGEMNHATLRVDPATRLPVYLLAFSPQDKGKSVKWVFNYPSDGPSDIYALGVPRDVKIDDLMPAENVQQVLAAMAASRARIGDFRLIVDQSATFGSSVVYRKGNKWRVEVWRAMPTREAPKPLEERDWDQWLAAQSPMPLYVCDGATVWENKNVLPGQTPRWLPSEQVAPQDLMSGDGLGMLSAAPMAKFASLVYPDLSPKRGWEFAFESTPADAPGLVLLKRSTGVTWPEGALGHEWYYLDPSKGYAVVRAELFNLPRDVPANPRAAGRNAPAIETQRFEKSPQGFWYPTIVHNTLAGLPGQPMVQSEAHYHFDFDAELPETLFEVDPEPQE